MSKIVVIESQPRAKQRMVEFLSNDGHSVTEFADAANALKALEQSGFDTDLMIVAWDIYGEVSGSEFLLRLKQKMVNLPVVVAVPGLSLNLSDRVFELGATDLLLKPIDGDRLRRAVRQALQDPKQVDPLVAELREKLVGNSTLFLDAVVKLAQAIRSGDTTVLLIGETGVGKEIFAQLVHEKSRTLETKIIATNTAGYSATLIESELFGHEKGAFTDAKERHIGAFERAGKGTLFLDEIGDLDLSLQPKLLRAIEEHKFYRVGGNEEIKFRARLVCATSRNLAEAARIGSFRKDLYFRINEFEIRIPPLRERKEDVRALVTYFLKDSRVRLEREALAILEDYSFPGNVRELQNILTQARAVCSGHTILPQHLPHKVMRERQGLPEASRAPQASVDQKNLPTYAQHVWPEFLFELSHKDAIDKITRQFDRAYLSRKIEETGSQEKAAKAIGTTPKTLRQWLKKCGLDHSGGEHEKGKG